MTLPLWTGEAARAAMAARLEGALPAAIGGVSIDTRTLQPGDLFFAIRGEANDAHDFVPQALAKGAAAAVVSVMRAAEFSGQGPLFVVPDVLAALELLGRAARERANAKIIAVTGSAGKTGTKEALREALSRQGRAHASVASYNNHWGVPLTLARMPADTEFFVAEIGMNHPGEILPLVDMVRPQAAIVTTIAPVHLEFFASTFAIADAKGEIFSGLQHGGTAIVNADIAESDRLAAHAAASRAGRIIRFGESARADVRLVRSALGPSGSSVEASVFGVPVAYRLANPGKHIVINSLAALAGFHALGADLALAALALADVAPPAGRGRPTLRAADGGVFTLIDESYNANPASMAAALDNLSRLQPGRRGRRIAIIGDMRELGATGQELHLSLAPLIEAAKVDLVFAVGPLMQALHEALPATRRAGHAKKSEDLADTIVRVLRAGDVVTVKGSLGTRMAPIVKAIEARFPLADQSRDNAA